MEKGQHMQTALITNLNLNSRTGSELHTLQVARQLQNNGYGVTCFCLCAAYPLLRNFELNNIEVLSMGEENKLKDHYDLFIAQHKLVSEYVYSLPRINFSSVYISILGVATEHEGLPFFSEKANGILAVSEEVKNHLHQIAKIENINLPPIHVFPNYYTSEYGEYEYVTNDRIKSVCCISNHPSKEELEAMGLLEANGIKAVVYGYQTRSVEITPELLSKHDVVISIGRTAQECMSLGIPYYCYDHFGGPGYISLQNFEHNAAYNFSGRPEKTSLTGKELYEDIVQGYESAKQEAIAVKTLCQKRFNFDALFRDALCFINDNKKYQEKELVTKEYRELLKIRANDYRLNYEHNWICDGELFYATKDDNNPQATQDKSFRFKYRYATEVQMGLPDSLGHNLEIIRFDPDNNPCTCSLINCRADSNNSRAKLNGGDAFLTTDPQYHFNKIHGISFATNKLSMQEVIDLMEQTSNKKKCPFELFIEHCKSIYRKIAHICTPC